MVSIVFEYVGYKTQKQEFYYIQMTAYCSNINKIYHYTNLRSFEKRISFYKLYVFGINENLCELNGEKNSVDN